MIVQDRLEQSGQHSTGVYFSDNQTGAGHAQRSLRGGAASLAARALSALIQVGSVLILARLLSPEDYGLVGMVTAITGFALMIVDLGTRDAVVQRSRITEGEVSALFWINVAVGCGFALLVAASGPLIARLYGEPRLTMIAVVSAVPFVTSALTCQHYALLRRAMKFRELGVIEVGANLFGTGGAIALALYGFQYWALVLRPVLMTVFLIVGFWLQCRWLPVKPTMTPGVKEMLRFGANLAGFMTADFAAKSSDRVAIGYQAGARTLGYYQNAVFIYENLLDVITNSLHTVAVASLSKMRDNLQELRRSWGKALATMVFYTMPLFGILAVTSVDLVVLLLGPRWASAGILLSILALRGIPHTVERTLGWLHIAAGRTDRWMRWGIFTMFVQLLALFSGLPFGPIGVAIAYVISMFILFIPALAYAGQPLGIGATDVIRVVWRQMAGSIVAAAIAFTLRYTLLASSDGFTRMALLTLAYVVVYYALVVGLFRLRMPIGVVLSLAQDFLPASIARRVGTQRFIDWHYEHP